MVLSFSLTWIRSAKIRPRQVETRIEPIEKRKYIMRLGRHIDDVIETCCVAAYST